MLSFPSQNDKKKISDRSGVLEKIDLGDVFLTLAQYYNFTENRALDYIIFSFLNILKPLSIITSGWQNVVKIYTSYFEKRRKQKKLNKGVYSEKPYIKTLFKNSIKLLASPFLVMLQTFYSKSTQKKICLGTRRALKYSGTQETWALRHSKGA